MPLTHFITNTPLLPPFPKDLSIATFGLGCFWGAEKKFWPLPGVYCTAVGYIGGTSENPTYEEVCAGKTGHNEAVQIIFDSKILNYEELLRVFWESHDPTQGMRQGNDIGTQYRSGIYTHTDYQKKLAKISHSVFSGALQKAERGAITTEILPASTFYLAEEYHQQYLAKNPFGYCGLGGTGVKLPPL